MWLFIFVLLSVALTRKQYKPVFTGTSSVLGSETVSVIYKQLITIKLLEHIEMSL